MSNRSVCNPNEMTHAEPQIASGWWLVTKNDQLLDSRVDDLGQSYLSGGEK